MDELQKRAIHLAQEGRSIFLTGSAGTGKSFTVQNMVRVLRNQGKTVEETAMTGCAAILLSPRARTLHSWAGVGLAREELDDLEMKIRRNKNSLRRWKSTDVLIIDEVSMLGPTLFEKLEALGRRLRRSPQTFFGGLKVILVGDFFQLPPVDDPKFLFESSVYREGIKDVVELKTVYRQKNDMEWYNVLQNVRRGTLISDDIDLLRSRTTSVQTQTPATTMTTLFPVNRKVDFMNDFELDRLGSTIHEFPSMVIHRGREVSDEQIKMWRSRLGVNEEPLRLAIGAQVMLTYNLSLEQGLVNGSQGVITGFTDGDKKIPLVRFLNRPMAPPLEIHLMEISNAEEEKDDHFKVVFQYVPLRLAWALSIHKVQGCNLDTADMDLGSQIFEYGQVYVALSRIRTLQGVFLRNLDVTKIQANPLVQEYYKQLEGIPTEKKKEKKKNKKMKTNPFQEFSFEGIQL